MDIPTPPALTPDKELAVFIDEARVWLAGIPARPDELTAPERRLWLLMLEKLHWECRLALDHPDRPAHRADLAWVLAETTRRLNA